jgi:hypothetical protein
MADIYNDSLEDRTSYPGDNDLLKAFRHLRDECGNDSHAEKFLISFVGRTVSSIKAMKTQLRDRGFDLDVRDNLVAEARSLSHDPIKCTLHRFLADISCPPRYKPVKIHVSPAF